MRAPSLILYGLRKVYTKFGAFVCYVMVTQKIDAFKIYNNMSTITTNWLRVCYITINFWFLKWEFSAWKWRVHIPAAFLLHSPKLASIVT